uniref:Uncharacterized protein n=1 Tax=Setaria italica TaxID=4555 RepID=K3Y018_SETIT
MRVQSKIFSARLHTDTGANLQEGQPVDAPDRATGSAKQRRAGIRWRPAAASSTSSAATGSLASPVASKVAGGGALAVPGTSPTVSCRQPEPHAAARRRSPRPKRSKRGEAADWGGWRGGV